MATEATPKDENLDEFTWDTPSDETSFFNIKEDSVDPPKKVEKPNKEDESEKKKPSKKVEEEEDDEEEYEDPVFFNQEEGDKDTDAPEEEEEEDEPSSYDSLATKLKEAGILQNLEIPEGESLDEEGLLALIDDEAEARVDTAIQDMIEGLDDDGKAFLKFIRDGGNAKSFLEIYNKSYTVPTGDIKDESYQEKLARYYYQNFEKLDSEDIDDKIEWLKESGKLGKYAAKFNTEVEGYKETQLKAEADAAKARNKSKEDNAKAFVTKIETALNDAKEFNNISFTPKDKEKLKPFITRPSIKTEGGMITGMQSKLKEVLSLKDPNKFLALAKFLDNDFDTTELIQIGKTKNTKSVKEDVQRSAPNPKGSGKAVKTRSLSDINL